MNGKTEVAAPAPAGALPESIGAVFFDVGGTLETIVQDDAHRLAACGAILGLLRDAGAPLRRRPEELLAGIKAGLELYGAEREVTHHELPPAVVWQKYLLRDQISGNDGLAGTLEAIGEELAFTWDTVGYSRELRPDAPAMLEKLQARGLRMGIISNTFSVRQVHHDLWRFAIGRCFDPIVLSTACGYRKPGAHIFHLAAELAGLPPASCMYVGDSPGYDVAGALAAGFGAAVLLRAPFTEAHPAGFGGFEPTLVITALSELIPLLS